MGIKNLWQRLFPRRLRDDELQHKLEELRKQAPVPVFWLFGKTQTGKTSIIRYLTGAEDAEIGAGFRPTTRFSRQYQFPTADAPLLTFLDTRGLDEPGYDSAEDIAQFNEQTHVVIVTARVMDHAQENVLRHLERIRKSRAGRPIVLALTCLHDAYPQQQHPLYPFRVGSPSPLGEEGRGEWAQCPASQRRSLDEQYRRFGPLVDQVVPLDLTKPEEGFNEPNYGGEELKKVLLEVLPEAYRQTLINVDETTRELRDWHEKRALPYILSYATLAATAGAIPMPFVDLFILPGIQTRMIYHLAQLYGQPLKGRRFLELAGTLGIGLLVRQAIRQVAKLIPGVGSVIGGALAGSSTYALGRAFCYYYSAVLAGHVPKADELRVYYGQQFAQAEHLWRRTFSPQTPASVSPETPARA
jgi:uncharacterized protein (DUF697 family)